MYKRQPRAYAAGSFSQTYGAFSPNRRWVAYASDESGQSEIYIDSFPEPGRRIRVTTAGGTEPRWRRDGKELYFRRGTEVHIVKMTSGQLRPGSSTAAAPLEVRSIDRLFDAGAPIRAFDVTPDGSQFLVNLPALGSAPNTATMVVNWNSRSHGDTETRR